MEFQLLSKLVSHALRHEPWLYELELDDGGWVEADALIFSLRAAKSDFENVSKSDLERMIAQSDKQRHEMSGSKIRALYGHSVPVRLERKRASPPAILYHGTSQDAISLINADGLRPMGRQYVHLSIDQEIARQVGLRKDRNPVILCIDAASAAKADVAFYAGNEMVWLADVIPPQFIEK